MQVRGVLFGSKTPHAGPGRSIAGPRHHAGPRWFMEKNLRRRPRGGITHAAASLALETARSLV